MLSPQTLLIGLGSGLASAVLFYSAARGGILLKLALFILTPLPTVIAGLGWSWIAAAAAAFAGALIMGLAAGPGFALGYLLTLGLPAILVAWLADLGRPRADGTGTDWYPASSILAALAAYAGAVPLLIAPLFGGSYAALKSDLVPFVRTLMQRLQQQTSGPPVTDARVEDMANLMIDAMPATIAAYWLLLFALNVYLAARIARASGHLLRDWPDLHRLTLPPWVALGLAAAILASTFDGVPRIVGSAFTGAFLFAYALVGLSVIHAIAKGRVPWLLWLTYIALINPAGPYAMLFVALIGLIDPMLKLRDRLAKRPPVAPPPALPPTT
jgi:hypothetical protein